MWLCTNYLVDWTAIAAGIALGIWIVDNLQKHRDRRATRRVLAQIMTTPIGNAQIEIAKFRCAVVPSNCDTSNISDLRNTQEARRKFQALAVKTKFELPGQFIEKAEIFGEFTSNRLGFALAQTNQLHLAWSLLGDMNDEADPGEIDQSLEHALRQIQETESAINEAYKAMLADGRGSNSVWRKLNKTSSL